MPRHKSAAWRVSWDTQPLGRIPDSELSKRLGVPIYNVQKERRARKIAACPRDRWGRAVRAPEAIAKIEEAKAARVPFAPTPQPIERRKKRSTRGLHDEEDPITIERSVLSMARTLRHLLTRLGSYSSWQEDCEQIKRTLAIAGPFIPDADLRQVVMGFTLPEMSFIEEM